MSTVWNIPFSVCQQAKCYLIHSATPHFWFGPRSRCGWPPPHHVELPSSRTGSSYDTRRAWWGGKGAGCSKGGFALSRGVSHRDLQFDVTAVSCWHFRQWEGTGDGEGGRFRGIPCLSVSPFVQQLCIVRGNPFRTAVPFWAQTGHSLSSLSPKRDCGPKRVTASVFFFSRAGLRGEGRDTEFL